MNEKKEKLNLIVLTGMSGAGKTVAIQAFEDLGYFTIDNMPPSLIPKFLKIIEDGKQVSKVAMVVDLRSRAFFKFLNDILIFLDNDPLVNLKVVFLDAEDSELVARYKETRRSHPLATDGLVLTGINTERELLQTLKSTAHFLVNTTELSSRQLREFIIKKFNLDCQQETLFRVEMMSFGFKYGLPIDADLVMDVRFLPNPYYVPTLRALNGQDQAVYNYVMNAPESEDFYQNFMRMLLPILPSYRKEGKSVLIVAFGCTGGQHRSVAFAERVGAKLKEESYHVNITHRDKNKRKDAVDRS